MALFTPRTYVEILGDMYDRLIASTPLTDLNFGSVWTTMLEAAAQEDDEQYFQMLEIIRGYSLDTTTGSDLDSRAFEYGLVRRGASNASTVVNISDSSVVKIFTTAYAGLPGAVAGSLSINADSATNFPTSGSIIIGRNTPNSETVPYSSITVFVNYVRFNLLGALAFDHGTDETIILSQGGDRIIPAGSIVYVPDSDISPKIDFELVDNATIFDGEEKVENVLVAAVEAGSKANVPIGAIQEFAALPFSTAFVSNPQRVTNGKDEETDQELRDRIKNTIQSLSRGTPTSITTGVIGITVGNQRVVSASLVEPTIPADVVKLYIDDGTGFIPTFQKVGYEPIVAAATGGERFLGINNVPIMKAFVETSMEEPYSLSGGELLFVEVNGIVETIGFNSNNFAAPGAATAQEVLTVINSNAALFEARLSSEENKVRIFARSNIDEEIRVTGGTANSALEFPTDEKFTTKLYLERNNEIFLLSKDGRTASLESGNTVNYNLNGSFNLSLVLDGKRDNIIDVWFQSSDFVTPSAVSAQEVCNIIESQAPGLKADPSSNNTRFRLFSNTERSAASKILIVENFDKVWNEEASVLVDRTASVLTNSSNATLFGSNLDYLYLGRKDGPFSSVYFNLSTPASANIDPMFEIWNGTSWEPIGVIDETAGLTQSGHLIFGITPRWVPNVVVSGDAMYYLRIQRNNAAVITSPIESRIRICNANEVFGLPTTETSGTGRDYLLNRFLGQIELQETLQAGDKVSIGSYETRAFVVSQSSGSYPLMGGELLEIVVDGILQSYTFQASDFLIPGSALESEVAAAINANFQGLTASVLGTRVKIRTNRYDSGGSLKINASAANAILLFSEIEKVNLVSHIPAVISVAGPYSFPVSQNVIFILDNNALNNFTAPTHFDSAVTSASSSSVFAATGLNPVFLVNDQILGFEVEFSSGVLSGQRRTISNYVAATGQITVGVAFSSTPGIGDVFQVIPVTAQDVVHFWNNKQVTLLSTNAEVSALAEGFVQVASLQVGENASVEVAGGLSNVQLGFVLQKIIGVDGYRYFTNLAQQTQWLVDGRLDDQENYPGIRAAGAQVEVAEPVKLPIRVQLTVTPREGVTLTSISNDVKSAVSSYVNNLGVGADVIISAITCSVRSVPGVFDVQIDIPSANVAVADNQLARIFEQDILVG